MMDVGIKVCDVLLGNTERAKAFCMLVTDYASDLSLLSGRFVIDAKSILGVFSLDISKPITLAIIEKEEDEKEALLASMITHGFVV